MIIFKTLREFLHNNKKDYIIGVIFLIFIDVMQLIIPKIYKAFADDYAANVLNSSNNIKYALLIMAGGLAIGVGRYAWRIRIFGNSRKAEYYLRDKIFSKLLTLSPTFYNKNSTGDLMALATNDVNAIRMTVGGGIVMMVDSSLMIFLSIVMMVNAIGVRLSLLSLSVMPIIVVFVSWFGKKIHKSFRVVQDSFGQLSDTSREIFSGIRVVKSFAADKFFEEKFEKSSKLNYEANVKMIKYQAFFRPFIMFISAVSFFLILYFGGNAVISGTITLGDYSSSIMYLNLLVWPLMAFGMVINIYQRGAASMERLNNLLDEEPDIVDPDPDSEKINIDTIEFKNVSFKYPETEEYVLKNINFKLEKGKSLAIIGKTGSGKSTIISLLLRLYDLDDNDKGEILINNKPIDEISLKGFREDIGAVLQDNFLFSMTIGDNISFGESDSTDDEEIIKAAQVASVHSNIMAFPDKYDTILGERGVTLSGGQKQRTSIARAIYKKSQLLILDSSFSAVDTETEEIILNNLKNEHNSNTIILISHRVSTVKDADEIIVLDNGEIVERGNNDELLKLNGYYAGLNRKQQLEKKIEELEV